MKVKVNVPNIATIAVAGPTQCGKSIVMNRVKEVLEKEFGASVVLNDNLQAEANISIDKPLEDWEKKMVKDTVWVLAE